MEEVEIGSWRKINVEQKYLPIVLYEKGKTVCAAEEPSGCGVFLHNHIWLVALIENEERRLESGFALHLLCIIRSSCPAL